VVRAGSDTKKNSVADKGKP